MKIARLHDGSTMQFPPETDDAAIHAAVRKRMGIDPNMPAPVDPGSAAEQDAVVLLQNMLRSMQALTMLMQQNVMVMRDLAQRVDVLANAPPPPPPDLSPVTSAIAQGQNQIARSHKEVVSALKDTHQAVKDAHAGIAAAVKAPRKVNFDKKGRPVGASVE